MDPSSASASNLPREAIPLPLPTPYRAVLQGLCDALRQRRGMLLLTGPAGSGKRVLLQQVVAELDRELDCRLLRDAETPADLYSALLPGGMTEPLTVPTPPGLRSSLELWLRQRAMAGTWTVLVLENADRLSPEALAEIDALAAMEPMLQLLLAARDDAFLERSTEAGVLGLTARVRLRYALQPLQRAEAQTFVDRLARSGALGRRIAITQEAAGEIATRSAGLVSRALGLLQDAAEVARNHWLDEITRECVDAAAREPEPNDQSPVGGVVPDTPAPAQVVPPSPAARQVSEQEVAVPVPEDRRTRPERRQSAPPATLGSERRQGVERRRFPAPPAAPTANPTFNPITEPRPDSADRSPSPLRRAQVVHGDGRDLTDPFRDALVSPSIDTPELLPVLSDPHSVCTEWFRVLRVRLADWIEQQGGGSRSIVITGPNSNVGKTVVAVNLALVWAQCTSQRVVLVDGDLRRPQHHTVFDIPRRPGFADLLAGRNDVDEVVAFVSEVGLHIIPAGRPGNPRQLANPERIARGLEQLRASFDVVLVDAPPMSGLVDARSMAAATDGVLMVVRAGRTRFAALQKSIDFLPSDNLIGTVLNGADQDVESAYAEYHKSTRRR